MSAFMNSIDTDLKVVVTTNGDQRDGHTEFESGLWIFLYI